MKNLRHVVLLLTAALVAACGGGNESSSQVETMASLQVHKMGAGAVTSTPDGIDCGSQCAGTYKAGTVVTLSATPEAGSTFVGWAGSGVQCATAGGCAVTVETSQSVTATFSATQASQYNLNLSVSGQGVVTSNVGGVNCAADCAAAFDAGTSVTLSAAPASGYVFAGWSGSGVACTGTGSCAVAMSADRSVTAIFNAVVPKYVLSVTGASASGTALSSPAGINCPTDCSESYDAGTVVTLSAKPAAGFSFTGWSGSGCSGTNTCIVTMAAARSVSASFAAVAANNVPLNLSVTGSGTVNSAPAGIACPTTCVAVYPSGTSVTLTPTPAAGYKFAGWTGSGCTGTAACTVKMLATSSVGASFVPSAYALDVTKQGTGTVSSSPAGIACGATCGYSFNAGAVVTLSATPAAGYSFTGWTGACSGTGNCIVTMNAKATATATFAAIYPLTVTSGTGGTVTSAPAGISCGATCSANYKSGTSVTLTAVPAAGYGFSAWSGACTGSAATCTVAMSQVRSVDATFAATAPTDTTPPTISLSAPVSAATSVSTSAVVSVTFSEAINCATVTAANFTVASVAGTVSCNGATATFAPSAALAYATAYTVQLSTAVKDLAGNALGGTRSWSFTTASAPATGTSFSFLAYGDSRAGGTCDGNAVHVGLVKKMAAEPADFVFNLGDMITGLDKTTNWVQRGDCPSDASNGSFKEIIAPLQSKTPAPGLPTFYFPVVGNHDDGWGDGWYPDKFGNGFCDVFTPSAYVPNHTQNKNYFADWKSSSVTHFSDTQFYSLMCGKTKNDVYSQYLYYSFDYKNSHFIVMRLNSDYYDLEECSTCVDKSNYDQYYNKHQLDWLRYDMAQASAKSGIQNIFVLTHAPLLTTSDGHAANTSWKYLLKEFSKYKAKIVFSGHAHVYERSYGVTATDANPGGSRDDVNGTIYTVSGGGGSFPDGFRTTSALSAARAGGSSAYHYLRVDVNGSAISVKAIGLNGNVIDSYTR